MTCSASTPAPWPPPTTPPNPTPLRSGCWITTCILPGPPAGTSRPGRMPKARRRRAASAPPVAAFGQAASWLEAERANLHAAAGYAAATGRPAYAVLIPAAMDGFVQTRGHWDQGLVLHQAALAAVRRAGDRAGQARAL